MNNPWALAAQSYGNDLNQGIQIQQQGINQAAQLGNSIYDRFINGYMQQKQLAMKEQEMRMANEYKNAQIGHLNAQNNDLARKAQDAQTAAEQQAVYDQAYKDAYDPTTGKIDNNKLSAGLARVGQGSWIPKAQLEILKPEVERAKITKDNLESGKAAKEQISSIVGTALSTGADPQQTLRQLKGLRDGNPELYSPHMGILDMVNPENPDSITLAFKALYGQGIPGKDLAPKTEIKDIGGKVVQVVSPNPLLGGTTIGQTLGYNPQETIGKINVDEANKLITPNQAAGAVKKANTIQPTVGAVMLQMGGPGQGYDGSSPLSAGNEALAKAIAENKMEPLIPGPRTPGAESINARAAFLRGGTLGGKVGVSDEKNFVKEFGAGGQSRKTLVSLDTATGHLTQLGGAINALGNADTKALNKFTNWFKTDFGGSADVTNFETVKSVAIPEVLKVAKGAGVINEAEEKRLNTIASNAENPAALKGFVREYQKIMGSRAEALDAVYQQYRPGKSVLDLVRPETAQVYRSLGFASGSAVPRRVVGPDEVVVRDKNGREGTIKRSELGKAKLEGYTEVR